MAFFVNDAIQPNSIVVHSYPWLLEKGILGIDSVINWTGWTVTEQTAPPATPTAHVAGEELNGGTGRRTTYVAISVDVDNAENSVFDLRTGLHDQFGSFSTTGGPSNTGGIVLYNRMSSIGGSTNPADVAEVKMEVFDPIQGGDVVIATATRTIVPPFSFDAIYFDLGIPGAVLNAIPNLHQSGDMLHLRISLGGPVPIIQGPQFICHLGKIELHQQR